MADGAQAAGGAAGSGAGGGGGGGYGSDDADGATLSCGAEVSEVEIDRHLTVFDRETAGVRPYDEDSRSIDIVQTDPVDYVSVTYDGPDKPAALVLKYGAETLGTYSEAGGEYAAPATYRSPGWPYGKLAVAAVAGPGGVAAGAAAYALDKIFTYRHKPARHTLHGIPGKPITVNVYNPDQWKLEFKLPAVRAVEVGHKWSKRQDGKEEPAAPASGSAEGPMCKEPALPAEITDAPAAKSDLVKEYTRKSSGLKSVAWKDGRFQKTEVETKTVDGVAQEQQAAPGVSMLGAVEVNCSLEKNGTTVSIPVLDLIGTILAVASAVNTIMKVIRNLQNSFQLGWYVKWEAAFIEGAVFVTWGWKEDPDSHAAYYGIGVGIELVLFSGAIEAGVGVSLEPPSGDGVAAQICFRLEGELKLATGPRDLTAPASKKPGALELATLEGSVKIGFFARFKVGDQVNAQAGVQAGAVFTATARIHDVRGAELEAGAKLPPLRTVVSFAAGGKVLYKKEVPLTGEVELLKPTFFPGKAPEPPKEIANVEALKKKFKDVMTNTFWNIDMYYQGTSASEQAMDQTAYIFATTLLAHEDYLAMTDEVVEGLAAIVRAHAVTIADQKWYSKMFDYKVEVSQLCLWMKDHAFQGDIINAYSPAKILRRALADRNAGPAQGDV